MRQGNINSFVELFGSLNVFLQSSIVYNLCIFIFMSLKWINVYFPDSPFMNSASLTTKIV
jgi:hypothetical protein